MEILPPAEPGLTDVPPAHPVPERSAPPEVIPAETVTVEVLPDPSSTPVAESPLTEADGQDPAPEPPAGAVAENEMMMVKEKEEEIPSPVFPAEPMTATEPTVDPDPVLIREEEEPVIQEPVPAPAPAPVAEPVAEPETPVSVEPVTEEVAAVDASPAPTPDFRREEVPAEEMPQEVFSETAPPAPSVAPVIVEEETSAPEPVTGHEAEPESIPAEYYPETETPPAVALVEPVLLETVEEPQPPAPDPVPPQEPVPAEFLPEAEELPAATPVEPAVLEPAPELSVPEIVTPVEAPPAEEIPEAVILPAAAAVVVEPVRPVVLETPAAAQPVVLDKTEPVIAPAVVPIPVESAAAVAADTATATATASTAAAVAAAVAVLPEAAPAPVSPAAPGVFQRLTSVDAYRGFVMLLMMGEVLNFSRVAKALPESEIWRTLAFHWEHAAWTGCTLHDLIQPSFSFLVGVALPFSLARRTADGQPEWKRTVHAFWRALLLVLLGVFLRSTHSSQTNWTFEDTLSQIGLGYGFLYILALKRPKVPWITFASLLGVYWLAFAVYRVPSDSQPLTGFASHWNLNANPAWAFDRWFLNLFPRENPFIENGGGYSTLSFIPTLATMILGLLAGNVLLRGGSWTHWKKLGWLIAAGLLGLGAGWSLDALGVCPVVKRIWTPSWVLLSGGWAFLILAAFYLVMEIAKLRRWAFVLTVVGMNSIAAYMIAHLFQNFISEALPRHFGTGVFELAGSAYAPFAHGLTVLVLEWMMLWWLFRRKVFLKI